MSAQDEPIEKRFCKLCNDKVIDSVCILHPKSNSLCYRCHLKNEHRPDWDKWSVSNGKARPPPPGLGPTLIGTVTHVAVQ